MLRVRGQISIFCWVAQSVNLDIQAGLYVKCPFSFQTCLQPTGRESLLSIQSIVFRFYIVSGHIFFLCILSRQSPCRLPGKSRLSDLLQTGPKAFHNWETTSWLSNQWLSTVLGWNRPQVDGWQVERTSWHVYSGSVKALLIFLTSEFSFVLDLQNPGH